MSSCTVPESLATTSCIGRAVELDALRSQFDQAMSGQGRFCVIHGGAGSGKSTLLRAFASALDSSTLPVVTAWGRCDQQIGNISPLAPWSQILQSFSASPDTVTAEQQLHDKNSIMQSLQGAVVELAPDIIELLIPGVGLAVKSAKLLQRSTLLERLSSNYTRPEATTVAADRSRLQDQYIRMIEGVLDKTPLVVVIDDLDCADEASLLLLKRLVQKTSGQKILFLVAMRDRLKSQAVNESVQQVSETLDTLAIDLDEVNRERGEQFALEYTGAVVPGIGSAFVEDLARHTGGHPLLVTELVAHLRRTGQIEQSRDQWRVTGQLDWHVLPRQIEIILADQLRGLDPGLVDILQAGSVQGDQFSIEVVAAALDKSEIAVARTLNRNGPKNLVLPAGSEPMGHGQVTLFRFSHSLARRYIYDSVDPLERTYLHRAVANQLEALSAGHEEKIAEQLAHQFEQGQMNDKASAYHVLAAEHATSTCSLLEATTHLQRALALCISRPDEMRIKYQLGKLQMMTGENKIGAQLIAEARTIAEDTGASELTAILPDQALALARINELDAAWQVAIDAERRAGEQGNDYEHWSALQTIAQIHNKRGRNQEALDTQLSAMPLARQLGLDDVMAESLGHLGSYLKELGRYEEAGEALQQSLAILGQGQPNYAQLAATRNTLADMYINLGDFEAARENLLQAIEHWRQFDRNANVAVGLTTLANLANREGLFEEGLRYGQEVYEEDMAALGIDHPDLAFSLTCIGESLLGMGNYSAAIASLRRAYDIRRNKGARQGNLAWSGWLLGRALVESATDIDEGKRLVEQARTVLANMGEATHSEVSEIDAWRATHPD